MCCIFLNQCRLPGNWAVLRYILAFLSPKLQGEQKVFFFFFERLSNLLKQQADLKGLQGVFFQ